MGPIYWDQFSWETFATLATGVTAVLAATVVGIRQAGIADRQARILERQVGLDDLKLRSELFDKRFAIYEATREFVAHIAAKAVEPEAEITRKFLVHMDQSKFLFSSDVFSKLNDLWGRSCDYFAVRETMLHLHEATGHYGRENVEKKAEYMRWLMATATNLSDIFGDELRLGDVYSIK